MNGYLGGNDAAPAVSPSLYAPTKRKNSGRETLTFPEKRLSSGIAQFMGASCEQKRKVWSETQKCYKGQKVGVIGSWIFADHNTRPPMADSDFLIFGNDIPKGDHLRGNSI